MLKLLLARLIVFGGICYFLAVASITVAAGHVWLADLLTFAWPYVILAGLTVFVIALALRKASAWVPALSGLCLAVYPYWSVPTAPIASACQLRIITANLFVENEMPPQAFLDFVRAENPDVLVLQETTFPWQRAIKDSAIFSHETSDDLMQTDRMKVFSRLPILSEQIVVDPAIGAGFHKRPMRLELSGWSKPLALYAIHPETPRSFRNWVERNLYLGTVSASAGRDQALGDVIVAGDWNTPIASPFFQNVMQTASLTNAGDGLPWQTTRFSLKLDPLLHVGSTIDHVAISAGLGVHDRRLGPKYGSNHLPVAVDIGQLDAGAAAGNGRCGQTPT